MPAVDLGNKVGEGRRGSKPEIPFGNWGARITPNPEIAFSKSLYSKDVSAN